MATRSSIAQMTIKVKKYDSAHAREVMNIRSIDEGRGRTMPNEVSKAIYENHARINSRRDEILSQMEGIMFRTDSASIAEFIRLAGLLPPKPATYA